MASVVVVVVGRKRKRMSRTSGGGMVVSPRVKGVEVVKYGVEATRELYHS